MSDAIHQLLIRYGPQLAPMSAFLILLVCAELFLLAGWKRIHPHTPALMLLAVTAGTIGDILLAKGMKEMGDISAMNLRGILNVAFQALTTPKLIIGTAMLAVFFFLWLAVLSWEDLSVALPMQALNYVLVAFLRAEFVERLGWLTEAQLIDAIAIGQVTPGPLFTSATFIGYLLGGVPAASRTGIMARRRHWRSRPGSRLHDPSREP